MENEANRIASYLKEKLSLKPPSSRLLVGLCGIPASGKSTFAEMIVAKANSILPEAEKAILVGLDGWHLTRAELDKFPDPKLAHDRRGSYWTFDGPAYLQFVKRLAAPVSETVVISAPSFDHALKDPSPDAVSILPHHRIVVIEGLYTCLNVEAWGVAARLLDERIYLKLEVSDAVERLIKRHVTTGVAPDFETAKWRANNNDMPSKRCHDDCGLL
ncbi:P-loop containing nucleoside triphosphate hydrolase protein [Cylindrobasidium torrendii FP15055 ss-10]|uniref:p-loop containing nucleoside triphosphate hydrolase protein n=1 Tax=Cylindrobasidium torrendii FP15055 ss-10 TaxID=1314674 RepID=A0A0D7BIN4_9AGAR|nr:P-loop containing nucleoside triphosphate hydrolase protein [Cylindrobasidium torrendii FP15055 ss-10]